MPFIAELTAQFGLGRECHPTLPHALGTNAPQGSGYCAVVYFSHDLDGKDLVGVDPVSTLVF